MDLYCTRPACPRPVNPFPDLDDNQTLKTIPQKYCTTCGMPLILDSRYLTQKLLGQGGFGAAFLAYDRRMPNLRPCVIKQFQPPSDFSPTQLQVAQDLFEREGEVLAELGNKHPQIPDLYAFFPLKVPSSQPGRGDEFFYLAQEFVDGEDLEHELAKKGTFSEAEVLEVLVEILQVLTFVHANGSIHRDIKPSNIMRHRNGTLYLLDFGAVKQVTKGSGNQGSTGIYSLGYAPPEQTSGGQVFPATDLYALAVTCLTLLTGKDAKDLFDSYSNSWRWQPHAIVSKRTAAVLNKLLLPAPSDRFQSAEEVLKALKSPAKSGAMASPAAPLSPAAPPPLASAQPSPTPAPVGPVKAAPPPSSPVRRPPATLSFSVWELLIGGGFAGFEGSLVAIALVSMLGVSVVSGGLAVLVLGLLVLSQAFRWIEKWDYLIFSGISLAIIIWLPALRFGLGVSEVLILAGLGGLVAIAAASLFRLVFSLMARFL